MITLNVQGTDANDVLKQIRELLRGKNVESVVPELEDGPEFEGWEERSGAQVLEPGTERDSFGTTSRSGAQVLEPPAVPPVAVPPVAVPPVAVPPVAVPPVAVPPAAVPPVAVPPVAVTPDSAELDRDGQPWDKRIHSSGRTKVADGTWKLIRGVSPELVAKVRSEHLGNPASYVDAATPAPQDMTSFNVYAAKVVASGKVGYDDIQQLLETLGYASITNVPTDCFGIVAGELRDRTGVSY